MENPIKPKKKGSFGAILITVFALVMIVLVGVYLAQNNFYMGSLRNVFTIGAPTSTTNVSPETTTTGEVVFKNCSGQSIPKEFIESKISRGFFSMMLVKAFKFQGAEDAASSYSDIPENHSCKDYIETAASNKFIEGSIATRFNPDGLITKVEALRVIDKVLRKVKSVKPVVVPSTPYYSDVTSDKWYFSLVQDFRTIFGEKISTCFDPDGNGAFFTTNKTEDTTFDFTSCVINLASEYK
jgi:hypothetical protein